MVNIASLAQTLPIMLIGMVGIFLVISVIILVVMLLGKLTGKQ
ncbi:MAG TPA: oxaloacetate decarboxylase [Candidatus Faecalibacterium faecipullorum]|uniref:Oxaloacetate decarboxylase n=1 Tax=Candidatus Faecalibacterium faecipullorum TaxID=2838578 RepID=A0A9D2S7F5_9FIRM|nr:oxaloacetate decarboxylase [Candidatus Faecalibacterium faecipullorum]